MQKIPQKIRQILDKRRSESISGQGNIHIGHDDRPILAFRPGETALYHKQRPGRPVRGQLYAVMLLQIPHFPDRKRHRKSLPLAVVCAQYNAEADAWQWVQLEPETKRTIGQDLRAFFAAVNRWYFMQIRQLEEGDES